MPLVSLLIEIMGKMSAKPMGSRGGGRRHTDFSSVFKRKGKKVEPMKEKKKKSSGIDLGLLIGESGCLFHLMQNKMSYNFKAYVGGFTDHRVDAPSESTLLDTL